MENLSQILNNLVLQQDIAKELCKQPGFKNFQVTEIVEIEENKFRFGFWRKLPDNLVEEFRLKEFAEQDPDCGWQYWYSTFTSDNQL